MSLFFKYDVATVTGIKHSLSPEMIQSIDLWTNILYGRAPWGKEARPSGIVESVLNVISNCVGEELKVSSDNELLDKAMKHLNEKSKEIVQDLLAVGGVVVRPMFLENEVYYEIIKLGNYIPLSYDLSGNLISCVITKKILQNKDEFLLIERHEYKDKNHSVTTELYKIAGASLTKVSLSSCEVTKNITPVYVWHNVDMPMIVEIRNRVPNRIDGSDVPCSIWQNTESLIEEADKQFSRINWEQEAGEMRIFADEDLFRQRQKKNKDDMFEPAIYPKLNKLIVKLSGSGTEQEKIKDYAPALRTSQQIEAFNQILRRAEIAWNIGKGTLSDLGEIQQTATQYTGGKKTLYTLIDSVESEFEEKYRKCAYIFAYMYSAFLNVPFDDALEITYNDAGRKNPDEVRNEALQELQNNVISVAEYRMRIFGEDEATASARAPEPLSSGNIGGAFSFE